MSALETPADAPAIVTVGDLKRALSQYRDDVRVVVDGYEAGYDNVTLCAPLVLLDKGHPYEGQHDDAYPYVDAIKSLGVRCLCLSRDDDPIQEHVSALAALGRWPGGEG